MKASKFFLILLAGCTLVSGCDTVRSFFGMPTSEDLQRLRIEQAAVKEAAVAEPAVDSVQIVKEEPKAAVNEDLTLAQLDKPYYVALGMFSQPSNAEKLASQLVDSGFDALKVHRPSGKILVLTCGSDSYQEVIAKRTDLLLQPFCPTDAAVYENTRITQ
ncbi:MAG: SPOR domain-containing protein [Bacteroidales bacterium]|nr:SPOR domain-containing protein [Bacteroidales bacterium]